VSERKGKGTKMPPEVGAGLKTDRVGVGRTGVRGSRIKREKPANKRSNSPERQNGRTAERQNGRTAERQNGRTAERQNAGRVGRWINSYGGQGNNLMDRDDKLEIRDFWEVVEKWLRSENLFTRRGDLRIACPWGDHEK
jgi:hypothetical protein